MNSMRVCCQSILQVDGSSSPWHPITSGTYSPRLNGRLRMIPPYQRGTRETLPRLRLISPSLVHGTFRSICCFPFWQDMARIMAFSRRPVETAAISYRVVDFLKKHPPFHAIEEGDLLLLARQGRVRFFEENEYIVWQGEPYQTHVFVIQQGTVSLWDEAGKIAVLRDVRGAGDMLGIEQFNDGSSCPYSAKSACDVVIYAFPASEFRARVLKHEYALRYTEAYGNVSADYQSTEERRDPQSVFLHELAGRKKLVTCNAQDSIREVARCMRTTGADAIAVVDSEHRVRTVLTAGSFLEWIEE